MYYIVNYQHYNYFQKRKKKMDVILIHTWYPAGCIGITVTLDSHYVVLLIPYELSHHGLPIQQDMLHQNNEIPTRLSQESPRN